MPNVTTNLKALGSFVKTGFRPPIFDPGRIVINPARIFESYWNKLGGSPGKAVSDVESVAGGKRMRYEHGALYYGGPTKHPVWVYGAIGDRYEQLGGAGSWLGFPLSDEAAFPQSGRVSQFEHGAIYWWPDVGAIELRDVVVHYTGLLCFGETDSDQFFSDSDEPYVVIGTVTPFGSQSTRSAIYDDVDAGEGVPDLKEIYRGPPYGITISSLIMEHDDENPDRFKDAMSAAVAAAATGVTGAVVAIPAVGGLLATVVGPLLASAVPVISSTLNDALDLADDTIGYGNFVLTAKDMVVMATRRPVENAHGVGYKVQTPLISGDGASYKACYSVVPA